MRVLAVGSMFPPHDLGGGYEITWRSSVDHLRARGDQVRILTTDFRAPGVRDGPEPDVRRELRWYWHDHGFPRLGRRARRDLERHNAAVLADELATFRPDAVAWWAMGGMSLALVAQAAAAGVPAVGVVGDYWMDYGPRVTKAGKVDLSAPLWLFNSEHTRRLALDSGLDLPHTRVVHPGIDHALFRAAPPRPEWQWRLLYVGRLDERKGVHVAAAALEHLPAEATLTLQGTGDPAYVARLRAPGLTFASEARAGLGGLYARADAVLFPVQWHEPWGLVPLEAMAVGRPVVATGTGGSAEYLRHEENCLIYEPAESAEALAAAVERLATDAELRKRLRTAGLATAAPFAEAAYNDAIAAALEEVAGSRAR
jgi:glycogen synthase